MAESRRIVVGCPIKDREWIFDRWLRAVEVSAAEAGVDFGLAFVCEEQDLSYLPKSSRQSTFVVPPADYDTAGHAWNARGYEQMVRYRNTLLQFVRLDRPDFYLSLDSDILLHPKAIGSMLEVFEMHPSAWAVGGMSYLSSGTNAPTYGMWKRGSDTNAGMVRKPYYDVRIADCLMAIVMMAPMAYDNIDYAIHRDGEDLGWSANGKAVGAKFWWDGRVCNKHVMRREHLDRVDDRCGF